MKPSPYFKIVIVIILLLFFAATLYAVARNFDQKRDGAIDPNRADQLIR